MSGSVTRKPDLRIGYLPQYRHIDLSWPMTGLDAALLATSARRRFGWVGKHRHTAHTMLRRLGVQSLASSRFSTLSGGQQQRILLAGAMAADPEVLLLDEPTDGLDVHSRDNLLALLNDFKSSGLALVIISHDVEDLLTAADQIARVYPADDPNHPATVKILSPDEFAHQLTARAAAASSPTTSS
jgi:ABC-type Mn2+/Zn2+ transport system ATPase subunit